MGTQLMDGKWPLESLVHTIHVKAVLLPPNSLLLLTSCHRVPEETTTRAVDHVLKKQVLKLNPKHCTDGRHLEAHASLLDTLGFRHPDCR